MQSTHPHRFHLSDIRKDVCLCLGRERIIEPLFAQQKLGSPKRRKKKLFPTVKSRASNELREPHQRSQFGEAQRTHPRTYRFNQFHLFDGLFMFGARADNRTAFCAAKTWFAVAAIFATQKSTAESRMSDFFGNRISGRKNAKCRVPPSPPMPLFARCESG